MEDFLSNLYEELLGIRTYLIKIGPPRRKGNILKKKSDEAKLIIQQFNSYVENIKKIRRGKDEERYLLEYCDKFNALYSEILSLCEEKEIIKMAKFDLKVALNLLPVMTDDISVTQQLIDGIDYYSSMIDTESQNNLITFVLKSRLSQAAKLKLSQKYDTFSNLIQDMKQILLPKKSAGSLQKQLLNVRQNDSSIDEFGRKLSELFVDLTISQSEGDSMKYDVLKKINEKQAIRQFSDGLRNRRISTIISAKNFENLKDAIQAAVDEDCSANSAAEIFSMKSYSNRTNFKNNSSPTMYYGRPTRRGFGRGAYGGNQSRSYTYGVPGRGWQPRFGPRSGEQQPWHQRSAFSPRGGRARARSFVRGNNFYNNNRVNKSSQGHIRVCDNNDESPNVSINQQESENEFFRNYNL